METQPALELPRVFIRQNWFEIEQLEPGVYAITEPFHAECVRSHLLVGSARALLVDTGMGVGDIRAVVDELTRLPITVVNSHSHFDHIGDNHRFDQIAIHQAEAHELTLGYPNAKFKPKFAAPLLLGPLPSVFDVDLAAIPPSTASRVLIGGEEFDIGGRVLEIMHAPGHSPGGIVLIDRAAGMLLSTDVVYAGPLYAYGVHGDPIAYRQTLARLAELVPSLRVVYPSHNSARVEPKMLVAMSEEMNAIVAGRDQDRVSNGIAHYIGAGFSILIDASFAELRHK